MRLGYKKELGVVVLSRLVGGVTDLWRREKYWAADGPWPDFTVANLSG